MEKITSILFWIYAAVSSTFFILCFFASGKNMLVFHILQGMILISVLWVWKAKQTKEVIGDTEEISDFERNEMLESTYGPKILRNNWTNFKKF
ncbi:hypothetical protein [Lacihabitans lacunae]|uniref:Uncharacterized protein n=1 Tax=Lacihabitans lacunae TaxID=1028214 RepID=A0ABV7YV41_9BACT